MFPLITKCLRQIENKVLTKARRSGFIWNDFTIQSIRFQWFWQVHNIIVRQFEVFTQPSVYLMRYLGRIWSFLKTTYCGVLSFPIFQYPWQSDSNLPSMLKRGLELQVLFKLWQINQTKYSDDINENNSKLKTSKSFSIPSLPLQGPCKLD